MTIEELHINIDSLNHSKESRAKAVLAVVDCPKVIPKLIEYAFSSAKNAHKVCWWLEFLNRQHIEILCPYIDSILVGGIHLTNDSAIRPIAKIIETFVLNYYLSTPNKKVLQMMTPSVKEKMVELAFQWLINDRIKVAPRAYSMTSLFHLGKDVDWVHSELILVVNQNYDTESTAYKARARMVLKKLK